MCGLESFVCLFLFLFFVVVVVVVVVVWLFNCLSMTRLAF